MRSGVRTTLIFALCATFAVLPFLTTPAPAYAERDRTLTPATTRPTLRPSFDATRCTDCHAMDAGFSHPVGIAPSMPMPSSLPLQGGLITCLTCHEPTPHDSALGRAFLRAPLSGASRCDACHQPGDARSNPHATLGIPAHLSNPRTSSHPSLPRHAGLDAESRDCVSCHDGSAASDAGAHTLANRLDPASEHPVGIRYDSRARPHAEMPLIPVQRLDPRIRLFDDRLGCGSCHSPYATHPNLLVMRNDRSALCLSCHADHP